MPIDRDEFEWLLACFTWLERTLGEIAEGEFSPQLALPNDPDLLAATTAPEMFSVVKKAAGLEHWECRLERGDTRREMIETGLAHDAMSQSSAQRNGKSMRQTALLYFSALAYFSPIALAISASLPMEPCKDGGLTLWAIFQKMRW